MKKTKKHPGALKARRVQAVKAESGANGQAGSGGAPAYGTAMVVLALVIALAFFIFFLPQNKDKSPIVISGLPPDLQQKVDATNAGENKPPPAQEGGNSAPAQTPQTGGENTAQAPSSSKEVVIDFLYSDGCGYCQRMKPIVSQIIADMPPARFEVRYWNAADRAANSTAAGTYAEYTAKGFFKGYPTFVANGNSPLIGAREKAEFYAWACSQFAEPLPDACNRTAG